MDNWGIYNYIKAKNGGGSEYRNALDSIIDRSITLISNDRVTSIGTYALFACRNLTEANFPNVTSIGGNAFQGCSNLTEVNFPNATNIGGNAFNNCVSLTTADFISVTAIQPRAFVGCTNLTTLVLRIEQVCALSNTDALSGTVISRGTGYIYVPDDLVEDYKTATNWTVYEDQIKGLSQLPEGV